MSLAAAPAAPAPVPYHEYARKCGEVDSLRRALQDEQRAHAATKQRLSNFTAFIGCNRLTEGQRVRTLAALTVAEAAPADTDGYRRVSLFDVVTVAGINTTPRDDSPEAARRAHKNAASVASRAYKLLEDLDLVEREEPIYYHDDPHDPLKITGSTARVRPLVSVEDALRHIRASVEPRPAAKTRGVHVERIACPNCGSVEHMHIKCASCGYTCTGEEYAESQLQALESEAEEAEIPAPAPALLNLQPRDDVVIQGGTEDGGLQKLQPGDPAEITAPVAPPPPPESVAALLCSIAGVAARHVILQPSGDAKYVSVAETVTADLAGRHICGEVTAGATLRHENGMARATVWEVDDADTFALLRQDALDLAEAGARPVLVSSPSRHHPGGGALWLVYTGLVDARSARLTAERAAPHLAAVRECWPGPGTCIRLPGGRYCRRDSHGDVDAWCEVWAPGGMHHTGVAAAEFLLTRQTPEAWVIDVPPEPDPPRRHLRMVGDAPRGWLPPTRPLRNGERDCELTRFAAAMARKAAMGEEQIFEELCRIRDELCEEVPGDPITDASLRSKARSAVRKYGRAS